VPGSVLYFDKLFEEQIKILKPKKILDVGVGAAKYGFISRYALPDCEIHGVEPESYYLEKYRTEAIYNKIYNKSIQQFIREDMNNQEKYDLVICGDVLEHMFLSEVHDVVDFFSYRCKWLLAQFPSNVPQFAVDGITWEVHRSNLQLSDFMKYHVLYYTSTKEKGTHSTFHHYLILSMLFDFDKSFPTFV